MVEIFNRGQEPLVTPFLNFGGDRPPMDRCRILYFGMERYGMPRIDDETVDVAFYLYPTKEAARAGDCAGGTGFIVLRPFERLPERGAFFLVTNKHVLAKGHRFLRLNRTDGKPPDIFEIEDNQLFPHRGPHDVAWS